MSLGDSAVYRRVRYGCRSRSALTSFIGVTMRVTISSVSAAASNGVATPPSASLPGS